MRDMENVSSFLDKLPIELIFKIMFFLDVSSKLCFGMVCTKFSGLIRDPMMWSHIIWKRSSKFMDESCLKTALKLSKNGLKNLSVSCLGKPFLFSKVSCHIGRCQSLNIITLNNVKLTSIHVRMILELPQLLELYLGPETYASLIFREISGMSTRLKVFGITETGNYYRSLLHDWSRANYTPSLVKVLLRHHSDKIAEAIRDIASIIPSIFPTENKADLCIYRLIDNLDLTPWDPIIHLQYSISAKVVMCFQKDSEVFSDSLVLSGSSCSSGIHSIATYYPDCKISRLHMDVQNEDLVSLHLLRHHNLSLSQLSGIAKNYPNLTNIDLKLSNDNDLEGLISITLQCSSLQTLSLDVIKSSDSAVSNELWQSMGRLRYLAVIRLSCNLVPLRSDPVLFSSLQVLHITRCRASRHQFIDRHFRQFTSMPILKSFIFQCIPSITVFSGFSEFLNSVKLTHLFIEKLPGNKLAFPLDSSCYNSLYKLCIRCPDFIFSDELTTAICKCEHLGILSLDICSIQVRSIKVLFDSLTNLMMFHVIMSSNSTFRSNKAARTLTKSLLDIARLQRRNVDIILTKQLDRLWVPYSDYW